MFIKEQAKLKRYIPNSPKLTHFLWSDFVTLRFTLLKVGNGSDKNGCHSTSNNFLFTRRICRYGSDKCWVRHQASLGTGTDLRVYALLSEGSGEFCFFENASYSRPLY